MIYKALYKCRYCDSVFQGGETTSDRIPIQVVAELSNGRAVAHNQGIPVSMLEVHFANNVINNRSHIGIADFIGFQIEE